MGLGGVGTQEGLVVGAGDFASDGRDEALELAPEVNSVQEGVEPANSDAVGAVVVARVVDAVVLRCEGNVVGHAELSNRGGLRLVGPLMELIGEGDEKCVGDDEEVHADGGKAAAGDGHQREDGKHRDSRHRVVAVSLNKVVLRHRRGVNVVLAEGANQKAKDGGIGGAPSVEAPMGDPARQIRQKDSGEDGNGRPQKDRSVGIGGVNHEAAGAHGAVNKQAEGGGEAAILEHTLLL